MGDAVDLSLFRTRTSLARRGGLDLPWHRSGLSGSRSSIVILSDVQLVIDKGENVLNLKIY